MSAADNPPAALNWSCDGLNECVIADSGLVVEPPPPNPAWFPPCALVVVGRIIDCVMLLRGRDEFTCARWCWWTCWEEEEEEEADGLPAEIALRKRCSLELPAPFEEVAPLLLWLCSCC